MLDKSVPYAGFFMRRKAGSPIAKHPLPQGYRYVFFEKGDEIDWARIETSVLEFATEFDAILRFNEEYMMYPDEISKRCLFIENPEGKKVAATIAWWRYVEGERRPWIHWVAVDTEYQGIGLGKAIISKTLEHMIEMEGDIDFYLRTQTWSYKAVEIYKKNGFFPTDERVLYADGRNNYKKAMKILSRL